MKLSHEEQLEKLGDLGLVRHPLEEDDCWGIFASTEQKAVNRFVKIKKVFPYATPVELKGNAYGDFGVDLYGELK